MDSQEITESTKMVHQKKTAKFLYRVALRKIALNPWLKEEDLTESDSLKKLQREDQVLDFQEKLLLTFPFEERRHFTNLLIIAKKLMSHKFFEKFPLKVVILFIMSMLTFEYFPKNCAIIKKGRKVEYLYFIIGGTVYETLEQKVPGYENFGVFKNVIYGTGTVLGEIELFFSLPRPTTLITGPYGVYLLRMDAKYFKMYSRYAMEPHWENLKSGLLVFREHFEKLPLEGVIEFFQTVKIVTLPAGKLVEKKRPFRVHQVMLLIKGKIRILRRLLIKQHKTRGYKLYRDQDKIKYLPNNVMPVFMNIGTHSDGACIGIGEDLYNNDLITETVCRVMKIPLALLNKYSMLDYWLKIKNLLDIASPKTQDIFQAFLHGRKWREYKKDLSKTIKRPMNNCYITTIHDLPIPLRAKNIRLKKKVLRKVKRDPDYMVGEIRTVPDEMDEIDIFERDENRVDTFLFDLLNQKLKIAP